MAVTDMVHHGLIKRLIHNSVEHCTQSEVFVKKLAEEECKHPRLTERVLEITGSNKTKRYLFRDKISVSTVKPNAQSSLSLILSEDDSTLRRERIRRQLRKLQQMRSLQRNAKKTRKNLLQIPPRNRKRTQSTNPLSPLVPTQTRRDSRIHNAWNAVRKKP